MTDSISGIQGAGRSSPNTGNEPLVTHRDLDALYENLPASIMSSHGQLSPDDRLIYYWAAKSFFSGAGTIVDAGALVGATTTILSEGVQHNPRASAAKQPIHVYDLFVDDRDGYSAQVIKGWFSETWNKDKIYDFEHIFRRNTSAYADLLNVHKGDITKIGYTDPRDIEVLSIDVAKSAALMHYVSRAFFPRLMQSRSIVLHQDYIFSFQPWLIIAMELMSDLLVKVYEVPTQVTAVFTPVRPITEQDVIQRLGTDPEAYYSLDNVGCIYKAIDEATTPAARLYYTAALAYFYFVKDKKETARYVARRMIDDFKLTAKFIERTELKHLLGTELGLDYASICC